MLKIWIEKDGNHIDDKRLIHNTDKWFNTFYKKEWMEHPLVKDIVLDIDKTTQIYSCVYDSPFLGIVAPQQLSGGVKALIMMLSSEDYIIDATNCGDNCAKWIEQIARDKDLTIELGYMMEFSEELEAKILNTGEVVHGNSEFIEAWVRLE